jgi:hypothetical protein
MIDILSLMKTLSTVLIREIEQHRLQLPRIKTQKSF